MLDLAEKVDYSKKILYNNITGSFHEGVHIVKTKLK